MLRFFRLVRKAFMIFRIRPVAIPLFLVSFLKTEGQHLQSKTTFQTSLSKIDTTYIETYPDRITTRLYLASRYTNFEARDTELDRRLIYKPNSSLNLGLGATYKAFTLNLGYGFGFLNKDEGQGETRYLDLQTSIYSRKVVLDIFGQFYKGMYLENSASYDYAGSGPFYLRPDIYEQILGFTAFYLFNHDRYTFRAALVQKERQLKSAESFLLGMEFYSGRFEGDRPLAPDFASDEAFVNIRSVEKMTFIKGGPSFGYAHTFVISQRFFVMLSLSVNIGIGRNTTYDQLIGDTTDILTEPSAFGRFAFGYNHPKWYLGLSAVNNAIGTSSDDGRVQSVFGIGIVRLNYAKRFGTPQKWKKVEVKIPG